MKGRPAKRKHDEEARFGDALIFRITTHALIGVAVVLMFLTLIQCTVKTPQSPTWTTSLTVPVINRTYQMDEIISKIDQDGVSIDSLGGISFQISQDFDTVALDGGMLTTPDISSSVSEILGPISINSPSLTPVSVSLSSITGLGAGLPGDSAIVVPLSFSLNNDLPVIGDFSQATFSSGSAYVVVSNNLGVSLDTVIIQLYDLINAQMISVDTFATTITSGTVDSLVIPLAGKTISSTLRAIAICHTPGGTVYSVSSRYIQIDLEFSPNLVVTSAVAQIPATSRSFAQSISLIESDRIDSASLAGGTLQLDITNATNLIGDLTIAIPDLTNGGVPLSIVRTIAPMSATVVSVDLAGYKLTPSPSASPQTVDINIVASLPGSGTSLVSVNQNDSFQVSATLSGLNFSSVSGLFTGATNTITSTQQAIDIPVGFDSIQLASATFALEIHNGIGLPGSLNITVTGNNGKSLNLVGLVTAGSALSPSITTISDTNAANFLSPIPTMVQISGSVTHGDGVTTGTITSNDFVFGRAIITSPLDMIINPTTFESDIQLAEIDTADIDLITDNVVEARFVYTIVNHLPLGVSVGLYFGNDSTTLFSSPLLLIDSLEVLAAPVDINGIVSDSMVTAERVVTITNADLQILNNDSLYIGPRIFLAGSGGQRVRFSQNDYLKITGRIEVDYTIDGEF